MTMFTKEWADVDVVKVNKCEISNGMNIAKLEALRSLSPLKVTKSSDLKGIYHKLLNEERKDTAATLNAVFPIFSGYKSVARE